MTTKVAVTEPNGAQRAVFLKVEGAEQARFIGAGSRHEMTLVAATGLLIDVRESGATAPKGDLIENA